MARKNVWTPVWSKKLRVWIVDFRIRGRRFRRRLPVRDRSSAREARELAEKIYRAALDEKSPSPVGQLSFREAADLYMEGGGERRFLERITGFVPGNLPIAELDEVMIARIAREMYPNAHPDTLRRQVRVPIKAVINFVKGNRRQKSTDNPRVRWLLPEEVERLLLAASNPAAIGLRDPRRETLRKIAFMIGTGAGPGEVISLTVNGWNPETREWWLPGTKSVFRQRFVRLPQRSVNLVQPLPSDGIAFPAPNGCAYVPRRNGGGQMAAAFEKVRRAAGLGDDVTPYVLRHTWATYFYAQTHDWAALLDQGGWNRSDTANRYRKIAPADLGHRLLQYGWDYRIQLGPPVKFGELVQLHDPLSLA